MKTKREVLKDIAKSGHCDRIKCSCCPYGDHPRHCPDSILLKRIGAIAILKRFPEKREFDISKILTCVTVDNAIVGMKGYFGDCIACLRTEFERGDQVSELTEILNENCWSRFRNSDDGIAYALFYPIDDYEVEE